MALSLYVLRHAKARLRAAGGGDHERELRGRGRKDARRVGRFLTRIGEVPDLVLTSTAVRARDTARMAHEAGAWDTPVELGAEIYQASASVLLGLLRRLETTGERVLLVGHQPALSLLIAGLCGGEPAFPTAALARIDLELERWNEIAPGGGRLAWLVTPVVIGARRIRTPE